MMEQKPAEPPPPPAEVSLPDALPSGRPPARKVSAMVRRLGYVGLAMFSVLFAVFAALWVLDIDLTVEDEYERAIREFASKHRSTDLRFPGADHQPVKPPAGISGGFDLSSSQLSFVEQDLDSQLAKEPGNSRLLFLRAQVHLLNLQYAQAIDILDRLRVFSPDDPALLGALAYGHYLRGRAERNTAELLRAGDFFQQALRGKPNDEVLLFNAAITQQRIGNRGEAAALFGRFVALQREDGWTREAQSRMRDLRR